MTQEELDANILLWLLDQMKAAYPQQEFLKIVWDSPEFRQIFRYLEIPPSPENFTAVQEGVERLVSDLVYLRQIGAELRAQRRFPEIPEV